jgi:aminoglycoside phosphotransferase (APT) family kinase protein
VNLGAEAAASVLARYSGSTRLGPALDSIQRARRRLSQFEAPRTLTHGCLCLRHTKTFDGAVIGVDDWGMASPAGEPLRELGGFAVRVADGRLPEVVAGRTSYAGVVRSFVTSGLERTELPRQLWREVLVLSQLELALEDLDRGDPEGITLLMTAVRALPAER